ncbi:class III signal peptide-containing protein, partial [Methanocaldococcus sp.]
MRGQLSLEFVLLLMLAVLAGTVTVVNLAHPGTNLNLSSDKPKSEAMGIFLGPGNGSIAVTNSITQTTTEQTTDQQTTTEQTTDQQTTTEQTTDQQTTKLPDIVASIEAYYEDGSLCCKGKHRVRNMGEKHQLRNRFGECRDRENLIVKAYIWNNGSVNIDKPFWVRIYTNDGKDLIKPIKINKLNVGETKVIELNIEVSKKGCKCHRYRYGYLGNGNTFRYGEGWKGCGCHISASTYQITVYADYNNTINESNEDNNIDSITLTVEEEHEKCHENSASLYIKFNGNSNGIITKSPIEGGEQISGPIEFRVKGNQV